MNRVVLLPLGVGDAFSQRYYSSCFAVGCGASGQAFKWLLVDCPHPIRKMIHEAWQPVCASDHSLRDSEADLHAVDGLYLTHLHADHCSGVEGWLYFNRFHMQRKPMIIGHKAVLEQLWDQSLAAGMQRTVTVEDAVVYNKLEDFARVSAIEANEPLSFGPFTITCRLNKHTVPTTAVRIAVDGRVIGYSSDTGFDPDLIDWLSDADLIVHETNDGIHTPLSSLLSLDKSLRCRLRLIHYPDDFDGRASDIEALQQGRLYEVKVSAR